MVGWEVVEVCVGADSTVVFGVEDDLDARYDL